MDLKQVMDESNNTKDILLLDLPDSYKMHTLKIIAAQEYFLDQCFKNSIIESNIPIFIKVTDDSIVFERKLINILQEISRISDRFVCGLFFPSGNIQYAGGPFYCMSPKAVKEIYEYARCVTDTPFDDDLYLTGVLRTLLNISSISVPGHTHFDILPGDIKNSPKQISEFCFLHNYRFEAGEQFKIWTQVDNYLVSINQ